MTKFVLFHLVRPENPALETLYDSVKHLGTRTNDALAAGLYKKIAVVDVPCLGDVYHATQRGPYGSACWDQSEGITMLVEGRQRSTRRGDIVVNAKSREVNRVTEYAWQLILKPSEKFFD